MPLEIKINLECPHKELLQSILKQMKRMQVIRILFFHTSIESIHTNDEWQPNIRDPI